jgi:four helix bundle protein
VAPSPGVPSNYRKLHAYQLAASLANELYAVVAAWPWLAQRTCGDQLVRAVDSVGANIAESAGRWHAGEKRQLFIYARGSLYETEHWLACARERGLLNLDAERVDEIARALNGLIKSPAPR